MAGSVYVSIQIKKPWRNENGHISVVLGVQKTVCSILLQLSLRE